MVILVSRSPVCWQSSDATTLLTCRLVGWDVIAALYFAYKAKALEESSDFNTFLYTTRSPYWLTLKDLTGKDFNLKRFEKLQNDSSADMKTFGYVPEFEADYGGIASEQDLGDDSDDSDLEDGDFMANQAQEGLDDIDSFALTASTTSDTKSTYKAELMKLIQMPLAELDSELLDNPTDDTDVIEETDSQKDAANLNDALFNVMGCWNTICEQQSRPDIAATYYMLQLTSNQSKYDGSVQVLAPDGGVAAKSPPHNIRRTPSRLAKENAPPDYKVFWEKLFGEAHESEGEKENMEEC